MYFQLGIFSVFNLNLISYFQLGIFSETNYVRNLDECIKLYTYIHTVVFSRTAGELWRTQNAPKFLVAMALPWTPPA